MSTNLTPADAPGAALAGLAEKTLLTFIEVALAAWVASGSIGLEGWTIWLAAGLAAAGTVIANALPSTLSLPLGLATIYRAVRTFVVSFVALFAAPIIDIVNSGTLDGIDLSESAWKAAAWAALPAALAVLKGAAASQVGQDTPALLPASMDVPGATFTTAA